MGLFNKKQDPFFERERDIQKQISAIQQEIQRLNQNGSERPSPSNGHAQNGTPSAERSAIPSFGDRPPRIRSTARPDGSRPQPSIQAIPEDPAEVIDPIFEEVHQKNPFHSPSSKGREQDQAMGLRQDDFVSSWERIRNHFRGPVTSNPKLVNYLAAGSIQGLRPLRYEKRVARNRFIALASILVVILWGILALIIKR